MRKELLEVITVRTWIEEIGTRIKEVKRGPRSGLLRADIPAVVLKIIDGYSLTSDARIGRKREADIIGLRSTAAAVA